MFIFFQIYSIMKVYIICCVTAQMPYLWKIRFLRHSLILGMLIQIHEDQKLIEKCLGGQGQKWLWPLRLWDSKTGCISRMNRLNKVMFCILESCVTSMIFQLVWSKMNVANSAVSEKWIYELNWFLECWAMQ